MLLNSSGKVAFEAGTSGKVAFEAGTSAAVRAPHVEDYLVAGGAFLVAKVDTT